MIIRHMNMSELLKLPGKVFFKIGINGYIRFLDDETYLKIMYRCRFHRKLNLKNPASFNEKLQWLKLHNRNPEYTRMVDKYKAKEFAAERIGKEYIIPTLGVWDKFEEIDFDALPDQFVLKCTHDSGGLVICHDKSKLDIAAAKKKIEKCLKRNYYYAGREWPYKNVKPQIIAEEYIHDDQTNDLWDYKFFVFDGKVRLMFICQSRGKGTTRADYFTREFEYVDFEWGYSHAECLPKKPEEFDQMVALAEKIAGDIPVIRVDFYLVNGRIYFGETTFYDGSGFDIITPYEWDLKIGSFVSLPMDGK